MPKIRKTTVKSKQRNRRNNLEARRLLENLSDSSKDSDSCCQCDNDLVTSKSSQQSLSVGLTQAEKTDPNISNDEISHGIFVESHSNSSPERRSLGVDSNIGLICVDEHSNSTFVDSDTISSSSMNTNEDRYLRDNLCTWATTHNVTHGAITDLLQIINPLCNNSLPKSAKVLLSTPRTNTGLFKDIGNGKYHHFGFEKGLLRNLQHGLVRSTNSRPTDTDKSSIETIHFSTNIDGLPIYRNSLISFWPILCSLQNGINTSPFVVGIYCGTTKPEPLDDFLYQFIQELLQLKINGVRCNGFFYHLGFDGPFVCDAPAKAYVTCIVSHSGYYGCGKCEQKGMYDKFVSFPEVNATLRTDISFREKKQQQHHKGTSPLIKLSINMVTQFVLDYMHLVCLGVTKRLLRDLWMRGNRNTKLSAGQCQVVSDYLLRLIEYTPREFARKPQSLKNVDRFKATEFRQFLLYTGPIVLKSVLPTVVYNHFLLFHVAIRILVSKLAFETKFIDYSHALLCSFVNQWKQLYGNSSVVYNVHGLTHLAEDCRKYGPLDLFSAFKYENLLGKMKRKIRSPVKPLEQIVNRYYELEQSEIHANISCNSNADFTTNREVPMRNTPLEIEGKYFRELRLRNSVTLKISKPDNCIITKNGVVLLVSHIVQTKDKVNNIKVLGHTFQKKTNFYEFPCKSSELGVYLVEKLSKHLHYWNVSDIKLKCALYPYGNAFVAMPIIHSV